MIDVNNSDDSERAADPMASSPPTEVSHTQTAGLTESELPELVGCQPDFPPAPKPNSSGRLTMGMTDGEILAHYRQHYPYIALGTAKGSYCTWLRFRHLGAAVEKAREQERQEAERRLRDLVNQRGNEGQR
jgi:hypothetical protein